MTTPAQEPRDRLWTIVRHKNLPDNGEYNLAQAEMNPAIYEWLAKAMVEANLVTAWEPFALAKGNGFKVFDKLGLQLIAHGMESDGRVLVKDSTEDGPGELLGGVIFHPPYFGSSLLSKDKRDLSSIKDFKDYVTKVKKAAEIAKQYMTRDGIIVAVSRAYRYNGELVRLDKLMLELFKDMTLQEVLISTPDVVHVFRRP